MSPTPRFIIAGTHVPLGESRTVELKFSESYLGADVAIPIHVTRAKKKGPKVFITGAIHGDELTGIGIVRELLYGDRMPPLERGTLVCMPVVNVYGLERHSRYLPDRRDLNRCFPGTASGSPSSRLAYEVFDQVVKQCDFGIDLHSAAVRRTNYPNVRGDMRVPEVKKLARAFGSELIVSGKGPDGSLRREAVKAKVPVIILEAGEVWKNEPGVVESGVRGCLNVLRSLEMIGGEPEAPLFQIIVEKSVWVRAGRGGFLGFYSKPGDVVAEGQMLARNYRIFGREQQDLISPTYGVVLGMTTMPAVKPGEPVYHIAEITQAVYKRIRKKIEQSENDELYTRIRDDLSTSIHLQTDGRT